MILMANHFKFTQFNGFKTRKYIFAPLYCEIFVLKRRKLITSSIFRIAMAAAV